MALYAATPEDKLDPRFAPLRNQRFDGLPDTLLLTMEYDPLRDEGGGAGPEDEGRRHQCACLSNSERHPRGLPAAGTAAGVRLHLPAYQGVLRRQ